MDNENEDLELDSTYEVPAVIYEGQITTRAGSPCQDCQKDNLIDPAELFN